MAHNLEQDSEENEAEVWPADKLPWESIKKADLVADNGWRTGLLAERASAVRDLIVAVQDSIFRDWVLAGYSLWDQLAWRDSFRCGEIDVG